MVERDMSVEIMSRGKCPDPGSRATALNAKSKTYWTSLVVKQLLMRQTEKAFGSDGERIVAD